MEYTATHSSFFCIGINHHQVPLAIRETWALSEQDSAELLQYLKDTLGLTEGLVLSTCNRTEFYYNQAISPKTIIKAFLAFKGVARIPFTKYQILQGDDASRHLYRVALGLESQIIGDLQIINQLKTAYQQSVDAEMAGPYLHRLLHSIFFLNKRVVQETSLRSGSASLSYATKELVDELVTDKSASILIVGLGEIGIATLRNLAENGYSNIHVCNRSFEKVQPLIEELNVRYIPFSEWKDAINRHQVVISALSGDIIKIEKSSITHDSLSGHKIFIDLGMPRSILAEIEQIPGVLLYNLEQIQQNVSEALEMRLSSVPQVEAMVEEALAEFKVWEREFAFSPLIHQIKNGLEQIRKEEMARFLKKANPEHIELAEELSKNLMQRIIKNHVVQLKDACRRGNPETLSEVLKQLFSLENEPVETR